MRGDGCGEWSSSGRHAAAGTPRTAVRYGSRRSASGAEVIGWVGSVRDSLRAQLWPLPTVGVVVAVVAGIVLPRLDAHVDGGLPGWLNDLLFGGDPDAARTVLDAVASSLITVTSLTFSLTVVTLQLASSQFSPRLLRTFTRDLFVQATLALFLATFAYSLTVLRAVRRTGSNDAVGRPSRSGPDRAMGEIDLTVMKRQRPLTRRGGPRCVRRRGWRWR